MIDLTARRASGICQNLKIIGLGGAGANVLDRMVLNGVTPASLIAANTDAQALVASVAGTKIQLGVESTRGLGSGGDPDLGRAASEEAAGEFRSELEGVDTVFLLAGLGGGTGSGAIPVIAEQARDAGALVIAIVTMPFAFEGKRRIMQAQESLAALGHYADLLVCFENDRMGDGVSPSAGIAQAFAAADQTIAQSVAAITSLLSRRGLVHLGFDDFKAVLRGGINTRCLFGYGEAEGGNRPFDALARALRNPLMDKGRLLRECGTVLVQVSGGPELTLNEVQLLMEELNRHVDDRTRILFGTSVDPQLAGRIAVTIFSSLGQEEERLPVKVAAARQPEARSVAPEPKPEPEPEPEPEREPEREPEPEPVAVVELPEFETTEETVESEEATPEVKPLPSSYVAAAQTSLFGDEPEVAADKAGGGPSLSGVDAARARLFSSPASRVSRPVPGRSMQSSSAFLKPQARPEPVAQEPAPEIEPAEEIEDELIVAAEPAQVEGPEILHEEEFVAPKPIVPERLQKQAEPPAPVKKAGPKAPLQETLKFEPVTRGRFEKSEPTIVDGQDLDVPTYLRRNIRVRP